MSLGVNDKLPWRRFPRKSQSQTATWENVLHSCSSRQVLMQTAMNSIQEFDGTNPEATISWLDRI